MYSNNKIKTFINKMKNRNINQTLKEKMDLLAAIKFQKTKTLIRKMKKNHLEFHWSPQKENKSKVHATKETIKVMVKMM
jgi:hypothetical protein